MSTGMVTITSQISKFKVHYSSFYVETALQFVIGLRAIIGCHWCMACLCRTLS